MYDAGRSMRIISQKNGCILASRAEVARGLLARLRGLIGRRSFDEGSALIIPGCKQVHTFLMRFPIDVVFADRANRVLLAVQKLAPCRVTRYCRRATCAIELPAGTLAAAGIQPGDILKIEG
jgi:uncharacterized membrane protein (UPF0127 family)